MKFRTPGLVLGLLFAILLAGCGVKDPQPSIADQQAMAQKIVDATKDLHDATAGAKALLTEAKATAAATTQAAATQPGGKPIADAAAAVIKEVDKAAKSVDVAEVATRAFQTGAEAVQAALNDQAVQNASVLEKVLAVSRPVAQTVHEVAPNTPADTYASTAVVAIAVLAAVGKWIDSRTTRTAIVTPGTTPAPATKP